MALVNLYGSRDAYNAALVEMRRYPVGNAILDFLEDDARPFDVVVLDQDENYGQLLVNGEVSVEAVTAIAKFNTLTGRDQLDRPTVFWNPAYRFDYFGNVRGLRVDEHGGISTRQIRDVAAGELCFRYVVQVAGRANYQEVPAAFATSGAMPAWIVLAHELGHAKQYYTPGAAEELTAEELALRWAGRLRNASQIEAENLAQHENPLCRQHGIPLRGHYKHSSLGLADVLQRYAGRKAAAFVRAPDLRRALVVEMNAKNAARLAPNPLGNYTGFFYKRA